MLACIIDYAESHICMSFMSFVLSFCLTSLPQPLTYTPTTSEIRVQTTYL